MYVWMPKLGIGFVRTLAPPHLSKTTGEGHGWECQSPKKRASCRLTASSYRFATEQEDLYVLSAEVSCGGLLSAESKHRESSNSISVGTKAGCVAKSSC
jgi:hypothetical protein